MSIALGRPNCAGQLRADLSFLRARLMRLYPLHLFMLLALLALMIGVRAAAHIGGYASIYDRAYHPMMTLIGFVTSLFLINGWNTLSYLTWQWRVSRFVSVEFALCLIFPLFLLLTNGRSWRGLGLVLAGLGGMLALEAGSQHGLDITFHNGVLRGLSRFFRGRRPGGTLRCCAKPSSGPAGLVLQHGAIVIADMAGLRLHPDRLVTQLTRHPFGATNARPDFRIGLRCRHLGRVFEVASAAKA